MSFYAFGAPELQGELYPNGPTLAYEIMVMMTLK